MNATDDIDDLLDQLAEYPRRLQELIDGAADDKLCRAGAGGTWGPVEVFCHLRDIEELIIERVSRMLNEDQPYMPAVDETLWPIEREYSSQDPRVALRQFAENRAAFVAMLGPLDAAGWQRRGYHSELGDQTVIWYARHAAEHDAVHEQHLRDLLGVT